MLKIFVTGDNHIGLKYTSHANAAELAAKRISAFEGMVQGANREGCDLFVITGDLFENTYGVSKREIRLLLDYLSQFEGTVVVLPGNHDFYDKEVKLWQDFLDIMSTYHNILLLREYRPYRVEVRDLQIVLYPALCTSKHSAPGQNNLGKIGALEPDADFHIGIAHGAVEGETIDSEGRYFLMKRSELEAIAADVWLIGHTHVPFPRNLTEEFTPCERIFNAGTHVQTDVSCNTEGLCFIVEIDEEKRVRAKKFCSGNLRFYRRSIAVSAGELEQTLRRELADIANESVVELILTGALTVEEYEDRAAVIEAALARFTEGMYHDYGLSKLISKTLVQAEFPEGSFSSRLLNALLDEPKEAQLAYELLKSLKEGK